MSQVCPLCGIDDFVTRVPLGPGYFEYTGDRAQKHLDDKPRVWQGSATDIDTGGLDGPVPYQDVLSALREAVVNGEPWVEYGIVEKRYSELAPDDFETLREAFGHRILGPAKNPHFTVSAYLAKALGVLRDKGDVGHITGKATGPWAYNGSISYWAAPAPGPAKDLIVTYEEHTRQAN